MVALLAAGRGRWAAAWYKWNKRRWKAVGGIRLLDRQGLLEAIDRPTYSCGEIEPEARKELAGANSLLAPPELCLRRPAVLAQIGWERLRTRKAGDLVALVPQYPASVEAGPP